ncbi:MAG: hypothetical protein ACI9DC_000816 [Gammaproteobacteria bacterium]|jgi:hypothetical protein
MRIAKSPKAATTRALLAGAISMLIALPLQAQRDYSQGGNRAH